MPFPLMPAAPMLSFGVAQGSTLTITVESGDEVEWASPHNGPFDENTADGTLAAGEARAFTEGVTVRSTGTSSIEVDIDTPLPEDPPPEP